MLLLTVVVLGAYGASAFAKATADRLRHKEISHRGHRVHRDIINIATKRHKNLTADFTDYHGEFAVLNFDSS